jgi:hypothetical protein
LIVDKLNIEDIVPDLEYTHLKKKELDLSALDGRNKKLKELEQKRYKSFHKDKKKEYWRQRAIEELRKRLEYAEKHVFKRGVIRELEKELEETILNVVSRKHGRGYRSKACCQTFNEGWIKDACA